MIVEKIESEAKKLLANVTKTDRVRIVRPVVLAPHVVAEAGDVYELPRWMANQLIGHGQAERVQDDDGVAADPATLVTTSLETAKSGDPKPKKVAKG